MLIHADAECLEGEGACETVETRLISDPGIMKGGLDRDKKWEAIISHCHIELSHAHLYVYDSPVLTILLRAWNTSLLQR